MSILVSVIEKNKDYIFFTNIKLSLKKMKISFKVYVVFLMLTLMLGCNLSSGSYPYAEEYELNYSTDDVLLAIEKLKKSNACFTVPKVTIDGKQYFDLQDEKASTAQAFNLVYFYNPIEKQIILTHLQPKATGITSIAVVSINEGLQIGNWKDINKDFNHPEIKKN
jgi:hypothetical protein